MVKILTDSTSSIPADYAREHGLEVVSLFIHEGDIEHVDATMDLDAFYSRLPSLVDDLPTSSQPSQHTLEAIFEKAACAGDSVCAVLISSKLSGTVDGAIRAARAVRARHLDFRAAVVDSASTGYDQAFPVLAALEAAKEGKSLREVAHAAADAVSRTRFLFAPNTLTYLQKGGRIGAATALLGNLISLVPVLTVRDGSPVDVSKTRTQRKALSSIFEHFKHDAEHCDLVDVMVHYIGTPDVARAWAHDFIEPYVGRALQVLPVSPVVGLHVGPAAGIAYTCKRPLEGKLTGKPSALITAI